MFYKVQVARFAETIRVGDNGEEIRYIDVGEPKYNRYTMTYNDNLLWIYDNKTEKMYSTSNANLRMMTMIGGPKECYPKKEHATKTN